MDKCPLTGRVCNNSKIFEISEIVDGKVKILSLCNRCAGPYFGDERMSDDIVEKSPLPTSSSLSLGQWIAELNKMQPKNKCPSCGSTIDQIQEKQCLGCLHCYEFFGDKLDNILLKKPVISEPKIEQKENTDICLDVSTLEGYIRSLERQLENSIKNEKYEISILLQTKLNEAQKIIEEKKSLQEKLDIAVIKGNFEKAKKIKNSIELLVIKYFSSI